MSQAPAPSNMPPGDSGPTGFLNGIVKAFLASNISLVLILLAAAIGLASLMLTPREEDPQIVVPLADIHVSFPGHSALETERLVVTPLEKLLYHIDGVEYVYAQAMRDRAIITVRFYVGEDRERSLVKLFKRMDEHADIVPPGVTNWIIKPVEIDDVPVVTLTLTSETSDSHALRRVGDEVVERLAGTKNLSRAWVVGGEPRVVRIQPDLDQLAARGMTPVDLRQALEAANVTASIGDLRRLDERFDAIVDGAYVRADELRDLVIGVHREQPIYVKDVATIIDGPDEPSTYVRHGWGPARGHLHDDAMAGAVIGGDAHPADGPSDGSDPAVTIALAKKKGTNAVWVARDIITAAEELKREVIPDDVSMVITRNYGVTADHKVNELVEGLIVAIIIVIGLLTVGLGWRESLIVAVAVPVVFGLTLFINLLAGYTINRVTLFALILALGLLVDDPIVDVENISRHFALRGKATRRIVLDAVAEVRPPLITATLAVIVSFLPMFFITGMMGPYMRPMALNVPVTMVMSMVVAFTITPWLTYHMLKKRFNRPNGGEHADPDDFEVVRRSATYRVFGPLMRPLIGARWRAWTFLGVMGLLTVAAMLLALGRKVPLKMLPFDNKNELLFVLNMDEGSTLERTDALARDVEALLRRQPEVVDFTTYVGAPAPMDFNGLVRHYYLRHGEHMAQVAVNLVGKKNRHEQSHAIGLRLRDDVTAIADRYGATLQIVETPPGPPVIATLVAEVYGRPDHSYEDLVDAAETVAARMALEPGVVEVDTTVEADSTTLIFEPDHEKAAVSGISVRDISDTLAVCVAGADIGTLRDPAERQPLRVRVRLNQTDRRSAQDLGQVHVRGRDGQLVPLAELGQWRTAPTDKTIYHKNLQRVVYVFGETAGRPPADAVVDIASDRVPASDLEPGQWHPTRGWIDDAVPRPVGARTFASNGSGIAWAVPPDIDVTFRGEGEWKITLDVFRDLGLAFAAAMVGIYILLVAQTRSFAIPIIVMLAIPLTVIGIMPGFYLLNLVAGGSSGGYATPIFFTATAMIGMIALAGIVTRNSIIIIDFIHIALRRGRSLPDAIIESCSVRLRPILMTAGTAMLSAAPIAIDPIFSGLAWALIFGLFASTAFTLFVIPLVYWLLYANRPGHGVQVTDLDDA